MVMCHKNVTWEEDEEKEEDEEVEKRKTQEGGTEP